MFKLFIFILYKTSHHEPFKKPLPHLHCRTVIF